MVVIGLIVAWAIDGSDRTATAGEPAPDFTVELLGGGNFSLDGHIADDGRPLLLNLWASWCAPCREEMPDLSAFAEANPDVAVIGVAVRDRPEDARAFAAEIGVGYPLALSNSSFEESYPNFGLPVTYFIREDGVIREVHNGIVTSETLEEMAAG